MSGEEKNIKIEKPKQSYISEDESRHMSPKPVLESDSYKPAGKLKNKIAIITGADSGIGASTAIYFAKEGAKVVLVDLEKKEDANRTIQRVKEIMNEEVLFLQGDVGDEAFDQTVVSKTVERYGKIDILVNNAAQQIYKKSIQEISAAQLDRTFRTNIFSMFYLTKAALQYMPEGSTIINSTSVTAYKGNPVLLDYSTTKGAIVTFTRSLAINKEVLDKKIRVNAVAPGPIWTPLIPATIGESLEEHGKSTPLGRDGQPYEVAPAYVYLASEDSSYVTGQVIHVNGGYIVNG